MISSSINTTTIPQRQRNSTTSQEPLAYSAHPLFQIVNAEGNGTAIHTILEFLPTQEAMTFVPEYFAAGEERLQRTQDKIISRALHEVSIAFRKEIEHLQRLCLDSPHPIELPPI